MIPYDISWSPKAEQSYINTLQYLDEHFTKIEVRDFDNHVTEILQMIRQFPAIYEQYEENNIHRCVLSSQVSLYYQVRDPQEVVELLVFWDNRQDPQNLLFQE